MRLKCAGCARTKLLLATSEIGSVGGQESDVKDVESYSTAPPPPVTTAGSVCQFKFKWPALAANVYIDTSGRPDAAWPGWELERGAWAGKTRADRCITLPGVVFLKCHDIVRQIFY